MSYSHVDFAVLMTSEGTGLEACASASLIKISHILEIRGGIVCRFLRLPDWNNGQLNLTQTPRD